MAVIGKFYCRVFCHINPLGDKISNTAATKQPNLFGFGKNITVFSWFSCELLVIQLSKFLKSRCVMENVRNGHIYKQLVKQHMT